MMVERRDSPSRRLREWETRFLSAGMVLLLATMTWIAATTYASSVAVARLEVQTDGLTKALEKNSVERFSAVEGYALTDRVVRLETAVKENDHRLDVIEKGERR